MKKKYCKDCKHFTARGSAFGAKEFYKDKKNNNQLTYREGRCWANAERKRKEINSAIDYYEKEYIYLDNPYQMNRNNDCKYYKRKWWKIT